tara:strand:+ start:643 stop:771 length:129 start_codon:yes stop_codon:yes gene_type:complete
MQIFWKGKCKTIPDEVHDGIAEKYSEDSNSLLPKGLGRKIGL